MKREEKEAIIILQAAKIRGSQDSLINIKIFEVGEELYTTWRKDSGEEICEGIKD